MYILSISPILAAGKHASEIISAHIILYSAVSQSYKPFTIFASLFSHLFLNKGHFSFLPVSYFVTPGCKSPFFLFFLYVWWNLFVLPFKTCYSIAIYVAINYITRISHWSKLPCEFFNLLEAFVIRSYYWLQKKKCKWYICFILGWTLP